MQPVRDRVSYNPCGEANVVAVEPDGAAVERHIDDRKSPLRADGRVR